MEVFSSYHDGATAQHWLELFEMNLIDIVALLIIGFSVVTAATRGLSVELFWLGGVAVGLIVAFHFYGEVAFRLVEWGMGPISAGLAAFFGIFLLGVVGGALAGGAFRRLLKTLRLGWIDRLLGAFFGLVRGALIVTVAFLALTAFPLPGDSLATSRLAPYFLSAAYALVPLAPADFEQLYQDGYQRLHRIWTERDKPTQERSL